MPETDGETKVNDFCEKIELKNVSFTYPGAKEESLTDVNLTMNKGETVAIVGHNGAGKSTLVRLKGRRRQTHGKALFPNRRDKTVIQYPHLLSLRFPAEFRLPFPYQDC